MLPTHTATRKNRCSVSGRMSQSRGFLAGAGLAIQAGKRSPWDLHRRDTEGSEQRPPVAGRQEDRDLMVPLAQLIWEGGGEEGLPVSGLRLRELNESEGRAQPSEAVPAGSSRPGPGALEAWSQNPSVRVLRSAEGRGRGHRLCER